MIADLKKNDDNPYPHKFHVGLSLTEFIEKYHHLEAGETLTDTVSIAGKCKLDTNISLTKEEKQWQF